MTIWLAIAIVSSYDCPKYLGFDIFGKAPISVKEAFCSVDRRESLKTFSDRREAVKQAKPNERIYQLVSERGKTWKRELPIVWIPEEG